MGRPSRQEVAEEVLSHGLPRDCGAIVVEGMQLAQQVCQRLMLGFRDKFNVHTVSLEAPG
jgi:hypothetical protein